MPRLLSAIAILLATAGPLAAQECSPQILLAVQDQMPQGTDHLDPSKLSCNGLAQVYFILTNQNVRPALVRRQRIEAVFRREGLIR